jgi:hypothetical protein
MGSATTATGINVPAGGDPFDPHGDMVDLANSLRSRAIYPVANATARNALLTAIDWTPTANEPLKVDRADTGAIERTTGSGWYRVSERALAVLKSGRPAETGKTLAAGAGQVLDLIAAGDAGGVPSITVDPGGEVEVEIAFQFLAASAGSAAAATASLVVDGVVQAGGAYLHTDTGSNANIPRVFTKTMKAWLSPGTPHTVNVRLTWEGGGGITVRYPSYAIRG